MEDAKDHGTRAHNIHIVYIESGSHTVKVYELYEFSNHHAKVLYQSCHTFCEIFIPLPYNIVGEIIELNLA